MSDNHECQKKKKREFHSYSEKSVEEALTKIRVNGMSVRKASITYKIPRSTLGDILNGRVPEHSRKMGPDTVLTEAEEKRLVEWCIALAKCGFPRRNEDLLQAVHKIVTDDGRKTPFKNGRPGKKWLSSFFKRHPELSQRTPEGISKGRAIVTEQTIRKWFSELKSFLEDNHYEDVLLDPTRIFNGDEAGFSMCPKGGKVIGPKGWKNIYTTQMGNEKENITVLLVFSASGETLPPVVVYPYVRPPKDVVNSMPPNWILGRSETGWMNSDVFFEYVANSFNQWIEENGIPKPVLLFIDGHKSHMTMHLSETCDRHGIILYALPPNATHIMQPADVSVFRPVKANWKDTIKEWQSRPENVNTVLTKTTFAPLLERTLTAPSLPETIRNGFRTCGLYPCNPDAVDYSKCVQNTIELLDKSQTSTSDHQPDLQDIQSAEKVIRSIAPSLEASGMDVSVILETISKATSSIPSPVECSSTSHMSTETSVIELDLPVLDTASPDILVNIEDLLNNEIMFNLSNHVAPSTEISEPVSLPMNTVSESILVPESDVQSIYPSEQDEVDGTKTLPSAQHDSGTMFLHTIY